MPTEAELKEARAELCSELVGMLAYKDSQELPGIVGEIVDKYLPTSLDLIEATEQIETLTFERDKALGSVEELQKSAAEIDERRQGLIDRIVVAAIHSGQIITNKELLSRAAELAEQVYPKAAWTGDFSG